MWKKVSESPLKISIWYGLKCHDQAFINNILLTFIFVLLIIIS